MRRFLGYAYIYISIDTSVHRDKGCGGLKQEISISLLLKSFLEKQIVIATC